MAENKYVIDNRRENAKKENFYSGFLEKIKKIKNVHIVIGVVLVAFFALVFLVGNGDTKTQTNSSEMETYMQIENRLRDVLSDISGAGRVSVMINFSGTSEIITATTSNKSEDKTSNNDNSGQRETESKTESTSPVIIKKDGEDIPLVVKEILPEIVGVIVVAEGANNVGVRINLLQAVQTLLNVSQDKIEIFTMK